jgi:hypothetical protein
MTFFNWASKERQKTSDIKKIGLMVFVLMFVMAGASYAQISIKDSPLCMDLMAGKNTDAGNICVEVADDILRVTYTTTGGWELTEAHLWVGPDLADMPQTKKGNPKIGHFPHVAGDITGQIIYSFSIPLTELGGDNYYDTLCDQTFFAAAHAALRIEDGNGGYLTETGWAAGERIVNKGNWAMYFDFEFVCEEIPPEPECETAFAYGDKELWDILDPYGNPITDEWGWQITTYAGQRNYLPIYAGATQNNPGSGTYVGDVYIAYSGSLIIVEYYMSYPYTMSETNLYVGTTDTPTADPEQFGHRHVLQPNSATDEYRIQTSGDPVYVVVHAIVCEPPEE